MFTENNICSHVRWKWRPRHLRRGSRSAPTSLADMAPRHYPPRARDDLPKKVQNGGREEALSRLLMAFVTSGLIFMRSRGRSSVCGTAPNQRRPASVNSQPGCSPRSRKGLTVGSFIRIGFYSIPKMRGGVKSSSERLDVLGHVDTGAALRWAANVYPWGGEFCAISAVLELAAFLIFFRAVSQHRPESAGEEKLGPWVWVVISASLGLMLVLVTNLAGCLYVSYRGATPAFPHLIDQRYLALMAWGFLVPFVWGFSAKWFCLSWTEATATEMAPGRSRGKSCRTRTDSRRSRLDWIVAICCWGRDCSSGAAHVRALRERSKDPGRALHFPFLCSNGVCVVARGRGRWRRRDTLGHFRWNLGRVASRFNGRVYIGDDPERRTAHPARVRRNETTLEHETYVRWPCASHFRLYASCFLRDHRLSGIWCVGMARIADFCAL